MPRPLPGSAFLANLAETKPEPAPAIPAVVETLESPDGKAPVRFVRAAKPNRRGRPRKIAP